MYVCICISITLWARKMAQWLKAVMLAEDQIQFPVPIPCFTTTVTLVLWGPMPSSDFLGYEVHTWCTYIHAGKTHIK